MSTGPHFPLLLAPLYQLPTSGIYVRMYVGTYPYLMYLGMYVRSKQVPIYAGTGGCRPQADLAEGLFTLGNHQGYIATSYTHVGNYPLLKKDPWKEGT